MLSIERAFMFSIVQAAARVHPGRPTCSERCCRGGSEGGRTSPSPGMFLNPNRRATNGPAADCFSVSGLASTWQTDALSFQNRPTGDRFTTLINFVLHWLGAPLRASVYGCSSYKKIYDVPLVRAAVRARGGRGFAHQTTQKHTTHVTEEDPPDQTLMLALAGSRRSVSGLLSF